MKKVLISLLVIIGIGVGALLGSSALTKNQGSEFAMALDNVNPMVQVTTVYGLTNRPTGHRIGGAGEDEYTYQIKTVDAAGNRRTLTFDAQKRLKLQHYLKIETKGQNVESWEAVQPASMPGGVLRKLAES
ncbi:YxeA family protein [Lactiplantibacillus daowaiensis]|uniref:YxeA family protein n=1 Tax=Lactiplantibacillus daowaiensis TaxID=2559918 RepID=A0ABW1S0Y8_9LACO|nr:YxeA family protein [Lactiplantibacillus daowaiensis]